MNNNTFFEIDPADFDHAVANLAKIRELISVNERLLAISRECKFEDEVRTILEELARLRTLELLADRLVKPVRIVRSRT